MPNRRPQLRLAFSQPLPYRQTPSRTLHRRLPKSSDRLTQLTDAGLTQLHTKLDNLRQLMPDEAAVVAALVDNLLAHYWLDHLKQEQQG
jgi:hypothetical protein